MALIALEGMHFYAYHGFYEEERIIGGKYIVDIYIDANTNVAAATDDLYRTINYETVFRICQAEMRKPSKLIEALAQRIISKMSDMFGKKARNIKIRIKKLAPPLGGRVDCAFIEVEKDSTRRKKNKGGKHKEEIPNFAELAIFDDFDEEEKASDFNLADLIDMAELPPAASLFSALDVDNSDLNALDLNDMDFDDMDLEGLDLEDFVFDED